MRPAFDGRVRAVWRAAAISAAGAVVQEQDVIAWHGKLFSGLTPKDFEYYAGHYRQRNAYLPCLQQNVEVMGISGADYWEVPHLMAMLFGGIRAAIASLELRWRDLTAKEQARHVALFIGWLIANFIRIHPFLNGNGRISRLLWGRGLLRFNVPAQCRISPRPADPYESLMGQAMRGNDGPLYLHVPQALASVPPTLAN
jgi:fido (protein-threonine AMPylation protein)